MEANVVIHTKKIDTKQFSTCIWNNLGKELGGGGFPLRTNRGGGEDIANILLEEIYKISIKSTLE